MTADEIRKCKSPTVLDRHGLKIVSTSCAMLFCGQMLCEVAAQLAELNSRLDFVTRSDGAIVVETRNS
jgi:hypothetical protein